MSLTDTLRASYDDLFSSCQIQDGDEHAVLGFIEQLTSGITRYQAVQLSTSVPWYVIGLIHGLEGSFKFSTHLHNGDSLQHRTVNEPSGRPPASVGNPPFTWEVSAMDALQYDRFTSWDDWSLAGICYKLEGYNGWGYRSRGINSPYLWSFSNHYSRGKFTSDGHFDPDAVSKQVGAITALWRMVSDHVVALKATKA